MSVYGYLQPSLRHLALLRKLCSHPWKKLVYPALFGLPIFVL
uniref:Uncharacterized protein n=1 Tax=Arundo donax TaxID=35708 RepID=A0A0A9EKK4_ARUDO